MSFQGKVVIVTGAGRGIGRCIAKTYAGKGAKVVKFMREHGGGTIVNIASTRACLYLTSEGNDFITGTNIVIDGGMTKKMI